MKITLDIAPATKTTCGSGKGKFCPHFLTRRFGSEVFCGVFNKGLEEQNGWTQHLPECIAAITDKIT